MGLSSALVLARPGHQREEQRGAASEHDGGDVFETFHVTESRAPGQTRHQRNLKRR
jgi:hypothetical protein